MRKKIFFLAIAILIVLAGFITYRFFFAKTSHQPTVNDIIAKVETGTIEQIITSQGKLEPKEYVDVGAQVSGQIKKLYVDIGDTVIKDDPIADIDGRVYEARVEGDEARLKTLQAQLAEQEAQIKYAQQQFDRNQRLLKSKAVSTQTLETSETDLQIAQARAASLRAQLQEAESTLAASKTNLEYTKIFAPISGTVVVLSSREGQTLNANQTAPIIVQLANLDTMTVRAQVAEADVLNLRPDMDVYFTILGDLQRRWQGKVRQVLPSPEIINEVVLYNVLIDVDNSDHTLMTGMTTQMFFVQGKAENVPLVPLAALRKAKPEQNNELGEAFIVYVPNGKKYKEKIVHVGLSNRISAEIRAGLSVGDPVLVPAASADQISGNRARLRMGPRL